MTAAPSSPGAHGRPLGRELGTLFAAVFILSLGASLVARQAGTLITVWLANGVVIASLATSDRARWPAALLVACGARLLAHLAWQAPWHDAWSSTLANALEAVMGAWLLHRSRAVDRFASDPRSLALTLVAGAVVPALMGATLGVLAARGGSDPLWWTDWWSRFVGSALGIVAVLPVALTLHTLPSGTARPGALSVGTAWFALAMVLLTFAALHSFPYPFVAISAGLIVGALTLNRLASFANVMAFVVTLAVAIALDWDGPRIDDTLLGHSFAYAAALLVAVPVQVIAVVVARRRALSDTLSAVGSRPDEVIAFADADGILRWVNQAWNLYWGRPRSHVIGHGWSASISRQVLAGLAEPLTAARQGQVRHVTGEVDFPARGTRTMDMVFRPALDEEGRQIGVVLSATNITELQTSRRELQDAVTELRASKDRLEHFARIVAHDLREPLNHISGFCGLIESNPQVVMDAAGRQHFAHVRNSAARMRCMLDDMLHFVRLDGSPEQPMEVVSLDEVFALSRELLEDRIRSRDAWVESAPLGKVRGHQQQLMLCMTNLLSNGIKFTPPDQRPVVVVSARDEGNFRVLTVRDRGIGIPAERLAELGTPFRRLHARSKFEGTGLGLAICKRIAEQHGGELRITSVPGEGSSFEIALPRLR